VQNVTRVGLSLKSDPAHSQKTGPAGLEGTLGWGKDCQFFMIGLGLRSICTQEFHQSSDVEARRRLLSTWSSSLVRRTRLSIIGDRAILVAASRLWNILSLNVTLESLNLFSVKIHVQYATDFAVFYGVSLQLTYCSFGTPIVNTVLKVNVLVTVTMVRIGLELGSVLTVAVSDLGSGDSKVNVYRREYPRIMTSYHSLTLISRK